MLSHSCISLGGGVISNGKNMKFLPFKCVFAYVHWVALFPERKHNVHEGLGEFLSLDLKWVG